MASALKRKRGSAGVRDVQKRAKPSNDSQGSALASKLLEPVGWRAAFNPPAKTRELIHTNGINSDNIDVQSDSNSPEGADFEEFIAEGTRALAEKKMQKSKAKQAKQAKQLASIKKSPDTWKLSESIGGRMIDADPVFTQDERYALILYLRSHADKGRFLIVANRTTILVYSTSNSLLSRSIKLAIDPKLRPNARIITFCLSPTNPDLLWVACSDGAIYSINWTSGAGADQYWGISSTGCIHMTVASMESAGRRRDVVFTTEARKDGGWRITANELAPPNGPIQTVARTIHSSNQRILFLKAGKEGSVIVATSGKGILLGSLRSADFGTIDKIKYEFRLFESSDAISSLDVRVTDRPKSAILQDRGSKRYPVVDVAIGDVKGSIFVHNDLLQNIVRPQRNSTGESGIQLIPRKLHWHRQAVHSVKWSLDGTSTLPVARSV
jgi:NET1-associated nuclear protein 1 (U3 small nucleolar RNA-associated protein 17)